jgi:predicted AlkP superfamily phosphohydrolase/phosphomutase
MFFKYLNGPASEKQSLYGKTIEDLYQRHGPAGGIAMKHVDEDTILFVLSDHGFCSFRRGVNLNSWLLQNG